MNLDDLLAGAMKAKAARDAGLETKAKLKDTRIPEKERLQIADKVREWESAHEYRAVSLHFRQLWFVCKHCNGTSFGGGQVLQREVHLKMAHTQRFIPQSGNPDEWPTLPRVLDHTLVELEVCGQCAHLFGFQLPGA